MVRSKAVQPKPLLCLDVSWKKWNEVSIIKFLKIISTKKTSSRHLKKESKEGSVKFNPKVRKSKTLFSLVIKKLSTNVMRWIREGLQLFFHFQCHLSQSNKSRNPHCASLNCYRYSNDPVFDEFWTANFFRKTFKKNYFNCFLVLNPTTCKVVLFASIPCLR